MKNKIFLFVSIMLLFVSNIIGKEQLKSNNNVLQGSITILSSPDLFELTTKWANEFCRLNSGVKINVLKSENDQVVKSSDRRSNLSFISNEYYKGTNKESNWKMVVGRDVIVPIVSTKNPYLNEIYQKGISPNELARISEHPDKYNWGSVLKDNKKEPINVFIIDDETVKRDVSQFLNINGLSNFKTANATEIIDKVQNDPYSIGFCKINDILGTDGLTINEHVKLLPIDKNSNGKLDYIENIYKDVPDFLRGVWIGKFPKALCRNIYTVSALKPSNELEISFLKWILSDGQQFLTLYGYSDLVYSERQSELSNLNGAIIASNPENNVSKTSKMALIILLGLVAILVVLDSLSKYVKSKKTVLSNEILINNKAFNESSIDVPKGLFFDKTHTWAFMEKDGIVKIGIDDFLQHITGTLTHLKLKQQGDKIKKGEYLLSVIQKGKQLNIYAPISGTVISQNTQLLNNSSKINSSPFSEGWVYMVEPSNWLRDIQFLFMSDIYNSWLTKEFSRLKDFLAVTVKSQKLEYAQIILQDGGELKDSVLEDLGPEVWEDFQTNFIDSFK